MSTPPIQLVCFDLGGVLIRLSHGWDHACEIAGVTPGRPVTEQNKQEIVELLNREEVGGFTDGEFYERAAPLLGLSQQDLHAMFDAWLCGAFKGVDTLIDRVNESGLQTACLSNTNARHWRAMTDPAHANGLPLEKLTYRFASHLVGERKPNAGIYQHVENATGMSPDAILYFDDVLEYVETAKSRGWHGCQITDAEDPVSQMTSHLKRHKLIQ